MVGTWINVVGIVLGASIGLLWKTPLSTAHQLFFKTILGALTALLGLRIVWVGLTSAPSFGSMVKQFLVVLLSLVLGRLLGKLLRLQRASNRAGQFARAKMTSASPKDPNRFSDGFAVCSLLFCIAPLAIVGSITDGLTGNFLPLAIKAVMDGLGAMGFVALFGFGVLLSAVPVMVFQGTLTLLIARFLLPILEQHGLVDPVNTTCGFLVLSVSLIVFEVRKVELTDYLPSLFIAPALMFLLR